MNAGMNQMNSKSSKWLQTCKVMGFRYEIIWKYDKKGK